MKFRYMKPLGSWMIFLSYSSFPRKKLEQLHHKKNTKNLFLQHSVLYLKSIDLSRVQETVKSAPNIFGAQASFKTK